MTITASNAAVLSDALVKLEQEIMAVAHFGDVTPDDVLLLVGDVCMAMRCPMQALPVWIQLVAKDAKARIKASHDSGRPVIKFSAKILCSQIERTLCGA